MPRLSSFLAVTGLVCAWPAHAAGQTEFSGTCLCKIDEQHLEPVGDRRDHALGVEQYQCDWPKPTKLGGEKITNGVATQTIDVRGATAHVQGVLVITVEGRERRHREAQGSRRQGHSGVRADVSGVELHLAGRIPDALRGSRVRMFPPGLTQPFG